MSLEGRGFLRANRSNSSMSVFHSSSHHSDSDESEWSRTIEQLAVSKL